MPHARPLPPPAPPARPTLACPVHLRRVRGRCRAWLTWRRWARRAGARRPSGGGCRSSLWHWRRRRCPPAGMVAACAATAPRRAAPRYLLPPPCPPFGGTSPAQLRASVPLPALVCVRRSSLWASAPLAARRQNGWRPCVGGQRAVWVGKLVGAFFCVWAMCIGQKVYVLRAVRRVVTLVWPGAPAGGRWRPSLPPAPPGGRGGPCPPDCAVPFSLAAVAPACRGRHYIVMTSELAALPRHLSPSTVI